MENSERDDRFAICPYCGERYKVEPGDYSQDPRTEECEECGKTYLVWQEVSVHTVTRTMKEVQP